MNDDCRRNTATTDINRTPTKQPEQENERIPYASNIGHLFPICTCYNLPFAISRSRAAPGSVRGVHGYIPSYFNPRVPPYMHVQGILGTCWLRKECRRDRQAAENSREEINARPMASRVCQAAYRHSRWLTAPCTVGGKKYVISRLATSKPGGCICGLRSQWQPWLGS